MDWIQTHYQDILKVIGALVTAASTIVLLTPSTRDDEIVGKIMKLIEKFSVFEKRTK